MEYCVGGGKVGEPKQNMIALGTDVVRLWGLMHEDQDPKSAGLGKVRTLFVGGNFSARVRQNYCRG